MYETHFALKEKPFSIQPEPAFLYFAHRHSLAYTMLEYAILNKAGFTVICGEIGCGKTTLVQHLLSEMGGDITFGLINHTHQKTENFLEWVMLAFQQPYEFRSPVALYDAFQRFLVAQYRANRRVVLIIDEAQNLSPEVLESLRMLSNLNADKNCLLQIILVGQPQLKKLLNRPELKQFAQRVSVQFYLPPLDAADVEKYIQHRLQVAGGAQTLFTADACQKIALATKGVPRSINILCDTALVYAFSAGQPEVDAAMVDEVLKDREGFGFLNESAH